MPNICINTVYAEGTPTQVDELIQKLSDTYDKYLYVVDNFSIDNKAVATLTLRSLWEMPKEALRKITGQIPHTEGLIIRITSEEQGEEYFEKAVFENGQWSFDKQPTINEQIHALTQQGIDLVRRQIQEKGNIHVKEDQLWIALYVDEDGNGTSAFIRSIELEGNGKLSVDLDDGTILSEDDLTTNHILDILSLIKEEHVTYS